jgi:hypothetical protein
MRMTALLEQQQGRRRNQLLWHQATIPPRLITAHDRLDTGTIEYTFKPVLLSGDGPAAHP